MVVGPRWFRSKAEVERELKRVREVEPCPRELTDKEMAWIEALMFRHPHAASKLEDWDGCPLRVDVEQSYGRSFVRCFVFKKLDSSYDRISMTECLASRVGNDEAVLRAAAARATIDSFYRALVEASDVVVVGARC